MQRRVPPAARRQSRRAGPGRAGPGRHGRAVGGRGETGRAPRGPRRRTGDGGTPRACSVPGPIREDTGMATLCSGSAVSGLSSGNRGFAGRGCVGLCNHGHGPMNARLGRRGGIMSHDLLSNGFNPSFVTALQNALSIEKKRVPTECFERWCRIHGASKP